MIETMFAVLGAVAVLAVLSWLWRRLDRALVLAGKVPELVERMRVAEDQVVELGERRDYQAAPEVDALTRKINALSNYGRTLEITGHKVESIERRVTRLESEKPPAAQNPTSGS